jgi:hypothetical protein
MTIFLFMRPSMQNYTETLLPNINETTANIKNTKNRILAISMAEPAILVNPSTAAIIAMTKNVTAQFNIEHSFPILL